MHSQAGLDTVDRAVARAVAASARWRVALRGGSPYPPPPLREHRSVAGQQAFEDLRARDVVSQDGEWRDALARWVAVLTVRRLIEPDEVRVAEAEQESAAHLRLEPVRVVSFRDAWRGLIKSTHAPEAAAWLDAAAERGDEVAAVRRELMARQEEVVSRLGFASWSEMAGGMAPATLEPFAHAFLRETDDLADAMRRDARREEPGVARALIDAVARNAPDGFPARLTLRTLMEMFAISEEVARGLPLEVGLPEIAGAASFARALEAFGVSFRRAAAVASRAPFALAADAQFVDARRFGFVFGALAMDPVFHRRGLGVVARVAAEQARTLAGTALLHARTIALQAIVGQGRAKPDAGQFEELTHRVFGQAMPRTLLGAFPALRLDDDPRLEALLTTLPLSRDLRDRFDEDWFRNPRAWRALRARASGPARVPAENPDAAELARAFEEALG